MARKEQKEKSMKEFKIKGLEEDDQLIRKVMSDFIDGKEDAGMVKKAKRQVDILMMFMIRKEMTYDDVLGFYESIGEDPHVTTISKTMDLMVDEGILAKQRRKCKRYVDGHQKSTSMYFYWVCDPRAMEMMEKVRKDAIEMYGNDKFPRLEFTPSALREREHYRELRKEKEMKEKSVPRAEEPEVKAPVEEPKPEPKPEPKKPEQKKGNSVVDLLTTLNFDEAVGRIYRGQKVVSAVSGVIYAMVPGEGIKSTANPKEIVTKFPLAEMEGKWRVVETPKMCPFCGGQVKLRCNGSTYQFVCTEKDCQATGPHALTPEDAVNKFNKRC